MEIYMDTEKIQALDLDIKTKKDYAYDCIKKMIINGEIKENIFISERVLSEFLHVSRTPIKAALTQLNKEGLLVEYPRKGYMIAPISVEDIKEIFELRFVLDPMALRSVLETDNETIRKTMCYHVEEMGKAIEQNNPNLGRQHDQAFHDCYFYNIEKKRLRFMLQLLWDQSKRFLIKSWSDSKHLQLAYQEHVEIVKNIQKKNIDGACAALVEHLKKSCEYHIQNYW